MRFPGELQSVVLRIYGAIVDVIIAGLIFVMLVVLLFSFFDVVVTTYRMIPLLKADALEESDFRLLVENVLDVFIVIELFATFTEYVKSRNIRMTGLLDVAVVFTLREILVKLYAQRFNISDLIGLCVITLLLVIARSITGWFLPRRNLTTNPPSPRDRAG